MLKFAEGPKTTGITSKKKKAFPEGNNLFAGDFCANLNETNADGIILRSLTNHHMYIADWLV